jgi:hypothetical protein
MSLRCEISVTSFALLHGKIPVLFVDM